MTTLADRRVETVTWTVDDFEVVVDNDWAATADALGGFEEALIRVVDLGRLPRGVSRGVDLKAYERGSGELVWKGTVDGDPRTVGRGLEIRGVGDQSILIDKITPRNGMTRDLSILRDAHDQPHDFADSEDIDEVGAEIKRSSLYFTIKKNEAYTSGQRHFLAAWLPGTIITRYAFDYRKNLNSNVLDIRTLRFTGSQGARTLVADVTIGSGGGSANTWLPIAQDITGAENALAIGLRFNAGTGGADFGDNLNVRIKNLRIYGFSSSDTMDASAVVANYGTAAGLVTARVETFANNILPFYSRESWAAALDYIAIITDRHWGVYEAGLEYGAYTTEWTCAEEYGAIVNRCDALRPVSSVIVNYPDLTGDNLFSELAISPDPNEEFGITPQAEFFLEDRQHNATLASNVATWNAPYLSEPGWELDVQVIHARQNGVPVSPYRIRPGGLLTVRDCHPMGPATERIRGVRYTQQGTQVFCNVNVRIAEEIDELLDLQRHRTRHKKPRHPRRKRRPRIPRD